MTTATDIDLFRFWQDNELAGADPFGKSIPQIPMYIELGYHAMFDEVGESEDNRRLETDHPWARACARAYNDRAERIIGRRVLDEAAFDPSRRFPRIKEVGELFECRRVWQSESWWLMESAHTPEELAALLDRVEKLDVEAAMFPEDWAAGCKRIYEQHGLRPRLPRMLRGPITLATSICGAENFVYLLMDEPALAARFRDVMLKILLDYFTICRKHSDPAWVRPGFNILDDNCALMTQEMYAQFGLPIIQGIYNRFAPAPTDGRYQHSDSDMEHLLPVLAQTGMNRVNFGPNVRFSSIRKAMPKAVVFGTLAPFTLMRNDEAAIEREVRRDIDEAQQARGLIVSTAGSVNNGTRLTSVRKVMQTIIQYGRFEQR